MANQYSKHLLKAYVKLFCTRCFSNQLRKEGFTPEGIQRYLCKKCNFRTTYPLQSIEVKLAKTRKEFKKNLTSENKKECSKCMKAKSLDMFYKRKKNKDGYRHRCIGCHTQYRKDNKDKISKRQKEYNKKNKDKIKEYRVEYYLENKDEIRRRNNKWALENKERHAKWKKEYNKKNKDKIRKYAKEYRFKNKDSIRKRAKEYRFKNKDYYRENSKEFYLENRDRLMIKQNKYYKENSENLTDIYIRGLLSSNSILSSEDIPQWFIKAKRSQMKLKRKIQKEK